MLCLGRFDSALTLRRIDRYSVQLTDRLAEFFYSVSTKQFRPISFHPVGTLDHDPLDVTASLGQAEHCSASVVGCRDPIEVLVAFKPGQKVVHGLLGHVRPGRELCWAGAIGPRALKDVHVDRSEVWMASGLQFGEQLSTNVEVEAPNEGG